VVIVKKVVSVWIISIKLLYVIQRVEKKLTERQKFLEKTILRRTEKKYNCVR